MVAEVYEQVAAAIADLEALAVAAADLSPNIEVSDRILDEMEEVLAELEGLLYGLNSKEAKRIKANLEKDYAECLKLGKFYEWLNKDGQSYTADYAEFAGQTIVIPTIKDLQARLKPTHLKLYQKMEKEGLEPKLQITPIALQISTLGKKIDAKRAELKINVDDTYVWDAIREADLHYAPTTVQAVKGGNVIKITGGKTKSQWIKDHSGILIDIIPTKPHLEADPQIQKDSEGKAYCYGLQAEKYAKKSKQNGFTPISYESYLLAQMRALKVGEPLETVTHCLLLDSNLPEDKTLAIGYWFDDFVYLYGNSTSLRDDYLRWRDTVRIL